MAPRTTVDERDKMYTKRLETTCWMMWNVEWNSRHNIGHDVHQLAFPDFTATQKWGFRPRGGYLGKMMELVDSSEVRICGEMCLLYSLHHFTKYSIIYDLFFSTSIIFEYIYIYIYGTYIYIHYTPYAERCLVTTFRYVWYALWPFV